jgi:hypothetical protein
VAFLHHILCTDPGLPQVSSLQTLLSSILRPQDSFLAVLNGI